MKLKFQILVFVLALVISLGSSESAKEEDENKVEKPKYVKPVPNGPHHFLETFDLDTIGSKWLKSKAKKEDVDDSIAKYDGEWSIESSVDAVLEGDKGLVLKSKAKHHAISAKLLKPFNFANKKPLIIQYEVKFQNPLECGGAYVKLLADEPQFNLENFYDKSSFSIMFGPDKCGNDHKYHFITRFKHPVKGTFEEKHAKRSELVDAIFTDGKTHLYTLILRPDNRFQMLIDSNEVNTGSLLSDLTPPINPPKEIVDPDDKKPENWDDRERIPDPDAVKPEDWDENEPQQIPDPNAQKPEGWLDDEQETIPDPTAIKPDDWDTDTDGEWEAPKIDNPKCKDAPGCGVWSAPLINNPKYKGKWRPPLIENSNYQGKWEPRKIQNPDYFEETDPFVSLTPFSAIGLELWSMTDSIYFDNFLITDDESVANQFAKDSWVLKKNLEYANSKSSDSVVDVLVNSANDKPWLWAVYVLIVLVPIVLIVVFCCGKSSSSTSETSRPSAEEVAKVKKTDLETKDDQEESNQNESDEKQELPKLSKEDLEDQSNDDDEDDKNDDDAEADAEAEEQEDEQTSDDKQEENLPKKSPVPVKRRAKKAE